jgi:Helix-turn-helix domain
MSLRWSIRVWRTSRAEEGTLVVLLALADYANAEGWAWPSMDMLTLKARCSKPTLLRRLRWLEAAGEVEVAHGSGRYRRNRYRLTGMSRAKPPYPLRGPWSHPMVDRNGQAEEEASMVKNRASNGQGPSGATRHLTVNRTVTTVKDMEKATESEAGDERTPDPADRVKYGRSPSFMGAMAVARRVVSDPDASEVARLAAAAVLTRYGPEDG